MTSPSDQQIEGYEICPCGQMVLEHVAYLTNGVCLQCFLAGDGRYLRETELTHRARRIPVRLASTVKRGPKKSKKTKKASDYAKRDALRQLRMLVPDLYDLCYAIQRDKRGLPPLPMRVPPGHFVRVVATLEDGTAYAAAESGGLGVETVASNRSGGDGSE